MIETKRFQTVLKEFLDPVAVVEPINKYVFVSDYYLRTGAHGSFVVRNNSSLGIPDWRICSPKCFSVPVQEVQVHLLETGVVVFSATYDRTKPRQYV